MNEVLNVVEVFPSIQGEGLHTGRFVTFVRLWGCNASGRKLECVRWCDTHNAWDSNYLDRDWGHPLYAPVTPVDLFGRLTTRNLPVVFTGGEPMIQLKGVWTYVENLAMHVPVAIETNGTLLIPTNNSVWITVSPKPPFYDIIPRRVDEVKLVVSESMCSISHLKELTRELEGRALADYYYLQPQDNNFDIARELIEMLRDLPGWRLGTQLHKTLQIP